VSSLNFGSYKLNHKSDPVLHASIDPDFHWEENPICRAVKSVGDHLIPKLPPVLDQGPIGSCAAHAGVGALEILLNLEGNLKMLSALHLYWIARALDGTTHEDAGTYLRSIVQQMHKIGVCADSVWPYQKPETMYRKPPPIESDIRASENRVSGYYKISSTGTQRLSDIATAIRADHPVIFGTQVGQAFMDTEGRTPLHPDPTDLGGGHATCLVGVQTISGRMSFCDKNSWSPSWASGGYAWLDQDYMTWEYTGDIWVLTRMNPIR